MQTRLRFSPMRYVTSAVMKSFFASLMVSLAMARPTGTAYIFVSAGGDLQAAINAAQCGDEIVLQAGATFSGNFTLPYKGACSGTAADYITIHTSNLAGIPP